ncbi:MAG: universal stress protein [Ignavibacteriales bacterium]|nr:universal stress protein [Ignavibacteriales bacterium]MCB9210712.1 universal stress protein [Ignavibacteriales bacterium]MCB9219383.1 universal stress protein [Ignavibacteriales bacterium]MCB9259939.1 universal stress protein [Ignavibacteriales bacterium]
MLKINKILYPTDFSNCAKHALTTVINFAEKYNSEVHILHVNTVLHNNYYLINDYANSRFIDEKTNDYVNEEFSKIMDKVSDRNFKFITTQKNGISPATIILEYAETKDIELIIMGTHGRRGVGHLVLGSIAEEVVRLAKCPVYTIKENISDEQIKTVKNVLVPIDFSERSYVSIKYAVEIAEIYKASIQLLHVIEDKLPAVYALAGKLTIYDLIPDIEEKTKQKLEAIFTERGSSRILHQCFVKKGHAAKDILKFAKEYNSDLIVIATHGITGFEHLFIGSVAEKVVRMSSCPVFTLKSFGKSIIN